ncbi:MAG: hypothetical protein Ta2A_14210 [Treponemataceae bacterium]|nr:MAG: hypothetical protein Ta2A_14210 [Treponemataceae bacterium]
MNTNLLAVVKQIVADYGENILENPQRLKSFFGDLAKDEPKPLRIAFGACVEAGAYNALKTAQDAAERASRKAAIAQRVRDDAGLDVALCAEALDILEAAICVTATAASPSALPSCKNCGKEIQPEWKACPYCGAGMAAAQPETPPTLAAPASPQNPPKNSGITNFVYINGGTFMMGSPASEAGRHSNETQHSVTVSGFYMSQHEVTQAEYQAVMGYNPSCFQGAKLPVETVSWYDAIEYCNKRSEWEGLKPMYTVTQNFFGNDVSWNWNANGYRLPTEAEWEYACRAGTKTPFNTGHKITTDQANYDNYPYYTHGKTTAVGSFAPNGWGLYDMHGNVEEWCWDWLGDYSGGAQTDPIGAVSGLSRVYRGGSWDNDGRHLRSAYRGSIIPAGYYNTVGFRVVRP